MAFKRSSVRFRLAPPKHKRPGAYPPGLFVALSGRSGDLAEIEILVFAAAMFPVELCPVEGAIEA